MFKLTPTAKRILHIAVMSYILGGLFYFYLLSDFSVTIWQKNISYYAWDKGKDLLLILCLINPLKQCYLSWMMVGAFLVPRLIWEIFAIKDYASASQPSIIFCLFIATLIGLILIVAYQFIIKTKIKHL